MARDYILHRTRTALGRSVGQAPAPAPPVRLCVPEVPLDTRMESFACALGKLGGTVHVAGSAGDARDYVANLVAGRPAVASSAPILRECGITEIEGVRSAIADPAELRAACAAAAAGITGADYALGDTGSLVTLSRSGEARMISLLPPAHIAVIARDRILTGLDELLTIVPNAAEAGSSMLLITGPSRTADIEQILVRGVHGPGEIHVVIV